MTEIIIAFKPPLQVRKSSWWCQPIWNLKNISQIGNLPQIGVKIKNIWNQHLEMFWKATSFVPQEAPTNGMNHGCNSCAELPPKIFLDMFFRPKMGSAKLQTLTVWG